ncbi:MAG: flippase-like domain-containing protein, partial [Bacteroidota bacterium]|nr:flippase-like domain-containing protein [Bacteroidota bacterium]
MKFFSKHPLLSVIAKAAVSAGLIAALVSYIDIHALLNSLIHAQVLYLGIGGALMIANVGVQFYRWRFLLRLLDKSISNNAVLSSLLIGFAAGFFTPGQIGEYGGRVATLRSLRASKVLAASLIDKLYTLAVVIVGGSIALLPFAFYFLKQRWNAMYPVAASIIIVVVGWALLYPQHVKRMLKYFPEKILRKKAVAAFLSINEIFRRKEARMFLLLTVLFYMIILVQYSFFARSFENVPLYIGAMCAASTLFVKSAFLPISIGDLGIREGAAIF